MILVAKNALAGFKVEKAIAAATIFIALVR
jgi:hypothetical protein